MKLIRQKTAAVFQRLSVESEAFKSFFFVTANLWLPSLFVTNTGWNLNFFQFAFAYLPRPCGQKRQESKPKQRLPKTVIWWAKKDFVWIYPPPRIPVTNRIIPFLVGDSDKPSSATGILGGGLASKMLWKKTLDGNSRSTFCLSQSLLKKVPTHKVGLLKPAKADLLPVPPERRADFEKESSIFFWNQVTPQSWFWRKQEREF